MKFFSDNAASVHPKVMQAIMDADSVDTAYDGDALSQRLDDAFSEVFDTDVSAMWIPTGTAANCLALAALCPSHKGIICHEMAHIEQDEAGAPGFYTGGAKLMLLPGEGAKIAADTVRDHLSGIRDDVHQVQAACLSITNATEYGLTYTPHEIAALSEVCEEHGLGLHMDGARFANAVAFGGMHPADITWKAGVDVLSFGFVKNGGMSSEALVFFNRDLAAETHYRRKRAGHLLSKGRYQAAQLLAMLDDDLWLENARASNEGARQIAMAAGERLVYPVEANEIFVRMTADEAESLRAQGFDFYDWAPADDGHGQVRFVTSWDQDREAVAPLANAIGAL